MTTRPMPGAAALSLLACAALVALVGLVGPAGCAGCEAPALACTLDVDCARGQRCTEGVCTGAPAGGLDGGVVDVDAGAGDDGGLVDAGPLDGGPLDAGPLDAGLPCPGDGDGDGRGPGCPAGDDCDDGDARVFAGHPEECDGIDNDCDGVVDDGEVGGCVPIRIGDAKDPRLLCLGARGFDGAAAECARRGYRLATFVDADEDDAVKARLNSDNDVWIGLRRLSHGNPTFAWTSDAGVTFSEFLGGEPSNTGNNEDCVQLKQNGWNDDDCEKLYPFLCEPAPRPPARPGAGSCADGDGDGRGDGCPRGLDCDDANPAVFALVGGVEDADHDQRTSDERDLLCTGGARPDGLKDAASARSDCDDRNAALQDDCGNCTTVDSPDGPLSVCFDRRGYAGALAACSDLGRNLVAVHDQDTEDRITQVTLPPSLNDVWIGLDDRASEGSFVFSDGATFGAAGFDAFRPGEPNDLGGNEDCVDLTFGGWNDTDCNASIGYVCR